MLWAAKLLKWVSLTASFHEGKDGRLGPGFTRRLQEESPQTRRDFCVSSKTGIEGACSTAVRDLSFDFFLLTLCPCWHPRRPYRLTHHPSEEQSRLVASRSCNPRKQSALKQSTEHFVWSTYWNTGKVKLELTAPIENHRPGEACLLAIILQLIRMSICLNWDAIRPHKGWWSDSCKLQICSVSPWCASESSSRMIWAPLAPYK